MKVQGVLFCTKVYNVELPEINSLTLAAQQGDTEARGKLMVQFQGYGRKLLTDRLRKLGFRLPRDDLEDMFGYIPLLISEAIDFCDVSKGNILGLMARRIPQRTPEILSKLSPDNRYSWLTHCRGEEHISTQTVGLSDVANPIIPDTEAVQDAHNREEQDHCHDLLQYALDRLQLRPKARSILQRIINGECMAAIANDLGVSRQTVSFLWTRSKEKMKKSLTQLQY